MAEDQNRTLQDKFMLRLPEGMREHLKAEASKSGRSMNAEIVHRLANSLENPSFADMTIGLGDEDLDWHLMYEANKSGRSLRDEMIHQLERSMKGVQPNLISELEDRAYEARKKYEEILAIFIQLTPEERRLLEERAEIAEIARKLKIKSKSIGEFVRLNPIGKRQHYVLPKPIPDYSPILGPKGDRDTVKQLAAEPPIDEES